MFCIVALTRKTMISNKAQSNQQNPKENRQCRSKQNRKETLLHFFPFIKTDVCRINSAESTKYNQQYVHDSRKMNFYILNEIQEEFI